MPEFAKGDFGLAGRICVVTGAGSGIGRGIALALAREGATVAVLDRDQGGAEETLALVSGAGGKGIALVCDVAAPASIEAAATDLQRRLGDADVLVNNAGILRRGPLDNLPLDDWNLVLSVNLTGYFLCSQIFSRAMREKRQGTLVHVASIAGSCATPYCGAYSVSKAGVTMLSQLLAVEWGPLGLRSNAVHPGMIYTPLSQSAYEKPGAAEARAMAAPSRRIGMPDDIAEAVVFLASPRSEYVNGAEITVDGGLTRNQMSLIPRGGYEQS